MNAGQSVTVSCSALKPDYRDRLRQAAENILIVYLESDPGLIMRRMHERNDHFMKTEMLGSQPVALEEPVDALTIDVDKDIELIVDEIQREIQR